MKLLYLTASVLTLALMSVSNAGYSSDNKKEWDEFSEHAFTEDNRSVSSNNFYDTSPARFFAKPAIPVSNNNNVSYNREDEWEKVSESFYRSEDMEDAISRGQKLTDIKELKKYFFQGNLEITPENYQDLIKFTGFYTTAFQSYDKGIWLKKWKASLDFEPLVDLLYSFKKIKSFKVQMKWDQEADIAESLARAIQFYEDLVELDLANCKLSDTGMLVILGSLAVSHKLQSLNVIGNLFNVKILDENKKYLPGLLILNGQKVESSKAQESLSPLLKKFHLKQQEERIITPKAKAVFLKRLLGGLEADEKYTTAVNLKVDGLTAQQIINYSDESKVDAQTVRKILALDAEFEAAEMRVVGTSIADYTKSLTQVIEGSTLFPTEEKEILRGYLSKIDPVNKVSFKNAMDNIKFEDIDFNKKNDADISDKQIVNTLLNAFTFIEGKQEKIIAKRMIEGAYLVKKETSSVANETLFKTLFGKHYRSVKTFSKENVTYTTEPSSLTSLKSMSTKSVDITKINLKTLDAINRLINKGHLQLKDDIERHTTRQFFKR